MSLKYCITQMFQVLIYIFSYTSYDIKCPHTSHWNLRAYHDCNDTSQYYCLFDENSFMFTEFCRRIPDFEGPGLKVVILGGLNGKMCAPNRYQPFMFWTNGSSECIYKKSLCSGEGQMIVTDKLTRKDTTCRCDYMRGFSFVIQPKHITYCVPTEEDCSCYNKQCLGGHKLNAGYQCVTGSLGNNGSTTSDQTTPSKNKSKKIVFLPENPKPGQIIIMNRIFVLTSITILVPVHIGKETNSCIDNVEITQTSSDVYDETAYQQLVLRETDQCIDEAKIQQTSSDVYKESVSLQPVIKEHEIHLEYVKGGNVQNSLISTKAFAMIYETVRANAVTIISGPPGCGKTSLCYQAALKLKETYNFVIVVVSDPLKLIESLNANTKQVILIDDIVGKYSLNESSLQMWEKEANFIEHFLGHKFDTKLIVTCRSYIYRNEKFRLFKLPHMHCDMLTDEMTMSKDERRQICKCYISEKDIFSLHDTILMLYNFLPLICSQYTSQHHKNINDYFLYPNDIIENEINALRLSADPCFIALGLLVIYNNSIDKRSLMVYDQTERTEVSDLLTDMQQAMDYKCIISLRGVFSSLSNLENIYVKEIFLTFTCINKSMFCMLVGTVGRHFIPCILKHSNSEFIKDYIELSQFSTERNSHAIKIESQYEKMYFRRIVDDINNGFNWDIFDSVIMKRKEYRLFFLENILKTEMPTFCKSRKDGSSPLHVTSLLGYNDLSFHFIENDKSQINSRDNTGKTPLHVACSKGNTAVAKILIMSNAEVNQMDINKVTPFMLACSSGNIELIKFLLTQDVHINAFNSFGTTPLIEACTRNNVKACSLLLENKAKVDCFNKNGDTPLHLACQAGQTEILNLLIKHDIDICINRPNFKGYTPFYLAISNGQNEIANTIIKHGADPNYQNENISTPLHIACETNKFEMVKTLLEQYQVEFNNEDNKGRTPLAVSKIHKHKDISKLLIDREQNDENIANIPSVSTSTC